jgi:DNA-binding response OmpR family regulator
MKQKDRILVVDDDGDACEMFAAVLDQAGYEVDTAADGFDALAKVVGFSPDLVLTDLQMPGMTGVELIRRVHQYNQSQPIVLMTGAETKDLCTGAEGYGAVDCLVKPVNLDELLWVIDCALACTRDGQRERDIGYQTAAAM